jgi:hypothetical protein
MRGRDLFVLCGLSFGLAACGGSTSTSTARPTPDAKAQVAEVKAAVTAFVTAYAKSEETGDAKPVEALTVPGSQAEGNSAVLASTTIGSGSGFKTVRLDVDESSWSIRVTGSSAVAAMTWKAFGYPTSYPDDKRTSADQESEAFAYTYSLQKVGGTWLVASFS